MLKFLKSFQYAWKGIITAFKEQLNLKIHFGAAILVVVCGIYFQVNLTEWAILVLTISFVITLELVNTAIEYLVDLVSPHQNPLAGKVKDIAAGAVLVASIGALLIGLLIFSKYIF